MRGNINSLMAQAAKMQQNLQRLQSELANVEVTGEACRQGHDDLQVRLQADSDRSVAL